MSHSHLQIQCNHTCNKHTDLDWFGRTGSSLPSVGSEYVKTFTIPCVGMDKVGMFFLKQAINDNF